MKNVSFSIKVVINNAIASVKKFTDALADANGEAKKAESTTGRLAGICNKLTIPNIAALASSIGKIGSEFSKAADVGVSFSQSMADLSAITGIVGDDLKQLEENARRFGKESGLGADTAARAYTVLASQIQVADIGMDGLNKLQEKSITLAQASGMSLDAAAESLAGTINQFGLSANEANRVINVLAAGSKYGAAEISELSQSFKVVGAAASAMGLDVESTAGALEVLSKANLKGAEAGTALRNIILKLNTTLGIDLGETSLSTALDALKPKLNDATYLSKLFGAENIAAAQFLIQNASAVDEMTRQLTGTNVAEEQAAIRTQTTAQRMAELRAQMDDIKISITNATGSFGPLLMIVSENAEAITLASSAFGFLMSKVGVLNQAVVKLTGSTILQNAASLAASAAAKTWTAVQVALNAVMSANPIAMVVVAIGALVSAAVVCYNKFEGFRKVCDAVWEAVKSVASAVWDYLVKAFERASKVIREAWQWIKNFFGIKDAQSAEQAAASIDKDTDAIERNTDAKKKNKAIILGLGATNTPGDGTQGKEIELNGLDETKIRARLQQVQQAIDAAPTLEKKLELMPEKQQLEQTLTDIKHRLDNAQFAVRIKVQQERDKAQGTQDLSALAPAKPWEEVQDGIPDKLQAPEIQGADRYTTQLTEMQQQTTSAFDSFKTAWGGLKGIGSGIGSITNSLKGNANAWQTVTGVIDGVIQLYESFQAIVAIAELFGITAKVNAAAKTQEAVATVAATTASTACAVGQDAAAVATVPVIAANKLAAASYMELATAAYMAAHAYIPFAGFAIASGFAAAAKAMVIAMGATPFAQGGIVSGPTYALVGEYAGAGSNPEVIAPLDRLRQLINVDQGGDSQAGRVTFRLQGRELLGLMEREGAVRRRR